LSEDVSDAMRADIVFVPGTSCECCAGIRLVDDPNRHDSGSGTTRRLHDGKDNCKHDAILHDMLCSSQLSYDDVSPDPSLAGRAPA
jgi:hypothetical protein